MTAILLLMAVSMLAGLPAALLVFATDPRHWDDDDAGDDDEYIYCSTRPDRRAARLLRSEATQAQLHAYMVGEGAR